MKTPESSDLSEISPATSELLEAVLVKDQGGRPDHIPVDGDMNRGVSPTSRHGDSGTGWESFRTTDGDDLKCKVFDENGKSVSLRIKQLLLIVK